MNSFIKRRGRSLLVALGLLLGIGLMAIFILTRQAPQREMVQSLRNQLQLIPSSRQRLEAQIERANTRLAQARQDIKDTRFVRLLTCVWRLLRPSCINM
ncbi:MAG TPA: hypothetical protein VFD09_10250 [Thiopseudomonas sp.]|nr:hypothetical protein [Thiopseudomonas sp.]